MNTQTPSFFLFAIRKKEIYFVSGNIIFYVWTQIIKDNTKIDLYDTYLFSKFNEYLFVAMFFQGTCVKMYIWIY